MLLDIDITSISSHAEAEALVERAHREALHLSQYSGFLSSVVVWYWPIPVKHEVGSLRWVFDIGKEAEGEQRENSWKDLSQCP